MNFFDATADYMVKDSGYAREEALAALYHNVDVLRSGAPFMTFGPYVMVRFDDDGMEEFYVARKVSSLTVDTEEQSVSASSHIEGVALPHILDDFGDLDYLLDD